MSSSKAEIVSVCIPPTAYRSAGSAAWILTANALNVAVVATYGYALRRAKSTNTRAVVIVIKTHYPGSKLA